MTAARTKRLARRVAGLVAGVLLSTQVLAAAQLCALRTAPPPPVAHSQCAGEEAVVENSEAEHHPAELRRCPTDDPSAQARGVDLPAAECLAVLHTVGFVVRAEPQRRSVASVPPLSPSRFTELGRRLL